VIVTLISLKDDLTKNNVINTSFGSILISFDFKIRNVIFLNLLQKLQGIICMVNRSIA